MNLELRNAMREQISGEVYEFAGDPEKLIDDLCEMFADALTSESVIRHGTYVLVDYITEAPIEEHLTRVVNSMLRDVGITKGKVDA